MICMRPGDNLDDANQRWAVEVHQLSGHLYVPANAAGLVVAAQAFGDSRLRAVQRSVVERLRRARMAICQIDLLDERESPRGALQDDVEFLAGRFTAVLQYVARHIEIAHLPVALMGSQRAAAAALATAIGHADVVRTVVCLAGNPNFGRVDLAQVVAPTILVVPGKNRALVESNQRAFWSLRCTSQLAVIRGAGRHFHESGTLLACREVVAQWCQRHLADADFAYQATEENGQRSSTAYDA